MECADCVAAAGERVRPEEFDIDSLAYLGVSCGGRFGGIFPAIEDRLQIQILIAAGMFPLQSPSSPTSTDYGATFSSGWTNTSDRRAGKGVSV